jgi:hypothetical protein
MNPFFRYPFLIGDIGTKSCIHSNRPESRLHCLIPRNKTPLGYTVDTDHIEAYVQVSSN